MLATASPQDRLMSLVIPVTESGCWIWLGALSQAGYGQLSVNAKVVYTHRLSWQLHHGKIPEGLQVLHRCDIRCCVNPDHLFLGTHTDNMRDMFKKNRRKAVAPKGEKSPSAKLTEQDVLAIRASPLRGVDLANLYGVTQGAIGHIRDRRNWKHI